MVRLILVNGPPGVGKSTLVRRYVDDHPMMLLIEIDALRVAMGGWADHDESRLQARVLALALARAHLTGGHDVVIPQYVGRPDFIDRLDELATDVGATFRHVVVDDDAVAIAERFRARRAHRDGDRAAHPEADVAAEDVDGAVADAQRRLAVLRSSRPDVGIVDGRSGEPYDQLLALLPGSVV